MKRSLRVAVVVLAALVLAPAPSRAHWVQTGFYECPARHNGNLTLRAPIPLFTPRADTLLVLENSSPTQHTCACMVLYDAHQTLLGAGLTDLSPNDNDTFDLCQLGSSLAQTKRSPLTGAVEVVTAAATCSQNGFASTPKSGPNFSAATAAWTKFVFLSGPEVVGLSGSEFVPIGPTPLKVIDTAVNNGTGLAATCVKQGVSVDEHGPTNFCVERSCPDP